VESENDIMTQIFDLARTKTVLLISHRLANVVGADSIYVMENGNVAEHGTHDELLAQIGLYSKLWNTQQALENDGKENA
jgi:ABC-type multidrug transport system fused ATPase/permease subunit